MSYINRLAAAIEAKLPEFRQDAAGGMRLDTSASVHFARQLEHIKAQAYDVVYPEHKGRMFVPVDNSANEGADTITYRQYDIVGKAQPAGNYTGKGPRVDVIGKEFSQKVHGWRDAYGFTTQDMRRARMTGLDLDGMKAKSARRAMEEAFDEQCAIGNTALGTTGIANHASIPLVVLPNLGAWSGLTPIEILDNLAHLEAQVVLNTLESFIPDTLLLDTVSYATMARKRVGVDNGRTVLQDFLANSPFIKNVDSWHRLNTAGAGSIRRIICYKRDPEVIQQNIPMEFTQQAPQWEGLEMVVECEARYGGVEVHYPQALAHADIAL